jgi:quercetin dioxygenase-like cupin family protein
MTAGFVENRTAVRHRETMTRLPELASAVIKRNIGDELEKLKSAPSWQRESGRSSETIVKYAEFRIVLVRMKHGSYMDHHRTEGPFSVHVILGRLRLHLPENRTEDLCAGELLALERGLEYDVEALEECAFLLTLAWPEAMAAEGL